MGTQVKYGSVSVGAYYSMQPASLQPAFVESWHEPKWDWQGRSPKTWLDKKKWRSLWSYGCNIGYGAPSGSDGASAISYNDTTWDDMFEPFSRDGEGTQSKNFLRGTCVDASDVPIANAIVQAFVTATDTFAGEVTGHTDGTYILGVEQSKATAHYLVAYKVGSPDIAGTTVNTLLPTNVDGT